MMQLVLKHTNRTRPIVSLPWTMGLMQGLIMERLPTNILTLTRAQVTRFNLFFLPLASLLLTNYFTYTHLYAYTYRDSPASWLAE